MAAKKKPAKGSFSAEERAAMKERAKELRANASRADSERTLLANIKAMPASDRALAQRVHELVTTCAPQLVPKLWYGMPAYARNDKIVCFFQSAAKFKTRYCTLGFMHDANLDEGG